MDLCPICLDCISNNKKVIKLCCNHCIHACCLRLFISHSAINDSYLCPLCKSFINPDDTCIFDGFNIRELYEFVFDIKLGKCNAVCKYSLNVNNMCKNKIYPRSNTCKIHSKMQKSDNNDNLILYKSLIFLFYFGLTLNYTKKYSLLKLSSEIFKYNNSLNICDLRYILIYLMEEINIKSFTCLCIEIGIENDLKKKIKIIK